METPVVKTKKGLSPIWILPLLALCLGGWLLFKDYQDSGFMITVQIHNATGLTPDKTKVFFRGLPIGTVKSFSVNPDLQWIDANIEMVKEAKEELTEDSKIWIVRPEVSFNKITGLDTLVKGSYFEVQPGNSKIPGTAFVALSSAPALSSRVPGLHLILNSKHDVSLGPGSPVYFKKVEVGEVVSNILQDDSSIETRILIYPKYTKHVTEKTLFFISKGMQLDANLPKLSIHIDPLKTILRGGISFITPTGGKELKTSKDIHQLYEDKQAAENADNLVINLQFSVENGLSTDSEIQYNGVKIGTIRDLKLSDDYNKVHARAYIHKGLSHLLVKGTYIYAVRAKLNAGSISNLGTLITGPYLNLIPGKGKATSSFKVHDSRPVDMTISTGLNIVLETDRLGSLGYDKPVYYRQVQVGKTTGYELSPTGQNVLIYVNISPPYINLIRENTKFWNSTGIRIKGGLMTTMKISTESLATLIAGGISFSTPEDENMGNLVANGQHFPLNADPDDEWLNWSPELQLGIVPEKLIKHKFVPKKKSPTEGD
jgi:paraquat-inducible protein B